MATLVKHLILCSSTTTSSSASPSPSNRRPPSSPDGADKRAHLTQSSTRRLAVAASTAMVATAALSARRPAAPPPAMAAEAAAVRAPAPPGTVPRWGTRSYVRERFFEPGLTTEEAAARIRQTAEGMRTLRPMLETVVEVRTVLRAAQVQVPRPRPHYRHGRRSRAAPPRVRRRG